jgi:hypothetical protein
VVGVLKVAKCGLDLMSITSEWKWNIKLMYAKIIGILIICKSLLCSGNRLLDHKCEWINKLFG